MVWKRRTNRQRCRTQYLTGSVFEQPPACPVAGEVLHNFADDLVTFIAPGSRFTAQSKKGKDHSQRKAHGKHSFGA